MSVLPTSSFLTITVQFRPEECGDTSCSKCFSRCVLELLHYNSFVTRLLVPFNNVPPVLAAVAAHTTSEALDVGWIKLMQPMPSPGFHSCCTANTKSLSGTRLNFKKTTCYLKNNFFHLNYGGEGVCQALFDQLSADLASTSTNTKLFTCLDQSYIF